MGQTRMRRTSLSSADDEGNMFEKDNKLKEFNVRGSRDRDRYSKNEDPRKT